MLDNPVPGEQNPVLPIQQDNFACRMPGEIDRFQLHAAKIKNMPVFDPDAEVSSLAFTIPSWCSTIGRTQRCANLKCVSAVAKMRLIGQLETLKAQADVLLNSLKE